MIPFPGVGSGRRQQSRAIAPPVDSDLMERGVFTSPYVVHGHPVLMAVDSAGELRAQVQMGSGIDVVAVVQQLERLLDTLDPLPTAPLRVLS